MRRCAKAIYGFTLTELLVVLAIIAIVTALLFPVFARVKSNALNGVSMSNLRQTGTALLLYADDWGGGANMPPYDVAVQVTAKMPTCDPKDKWRSSCEVPVPRPQLGSYGYTPAILEDLNSIGETLNGEPLTWSQYIVKENPILLIDPFYGDEKPCPFIQYPPEVTRERLENYMLGCKSKGLNWRFPAIFLRVRLDTSVEVRKFKRGHWLGADWSAGLL